MAHESNEYQTATFAGGCFWCMVEPFKKLEGVIDVISGYTGGHVKNPDYEDVTTGYSGHYESVQVIYDPAKINYSDLLDVFWRQIDPTDEFGQFGDRGDQYRTAIFYHDEEQREVAKKSKNRLEELNLFNYPIATEIIAAQPFYKAEEHHQNYYAKNSGHYEFYKKGSGREDFINKAWGNIDEKLEELNEHRFLVTQKNETEKPYKYWDN
ncbi:Peptide-methionine (S)-S-oxide reductase MsrA [Candidatus Syntrophocurvum alkaliphilum]|uniref:Peptide methionine sulfoxide reductase MsrA n=1 Tax=Candidatus Syntrophocurvum alkaliphilum TaxID=2293317 RepID=A0A6I6DJ51_9FIRM|nr:peptide-methionine (S)-S-oxide reductase MsrA [Candidatus Syntrophocurvum alkaliphilum]QGU00834.1 Peptide-methionine (S)-S-oxide reductase MsrA [Candidatus Syntrophocurvum alkaliphilum]